MFVKQDRIDYLHDKPLRILISVVTPLAAVYLVQIFTSALVNSIYSRYVGQDAFAVTGYLSTVVSFFNTLANGAASAAWIKIAHSFHEGNRRRAEEQMFDAVCTVVAIASIVGIGLALFADPLLRAVNVPETLHQKAKLYFVLNVLAFIPVPVATFFLTVINGTGSILRLLLINLFSVFLNAAMAYLLLGVCHAGVAGLALLAGCNAAVQLALYALILRRDGYRLRITGLPKLKRMWSISKYGFLIALQNILCTAGYLVVSLQTNRLLPADYISVLSVSLPVTGVMSAFTTAITVFCPPNYAAGAYKRLKRFVGMAFCGVFGYSLLCFAVYALIGRWYFSRLFDNPRVIAYGTEFWFWQGLGFVFVSPLFVVRFYLDTIGESKLALLCGMGEIVGNTLCALWLIPVLGTLGRSVSQTMGWFLASLCLIVAYLMADRKLRTAQCKAESFENGGKRT